MCGSVNTRLKFVLWFLAAGISAPLALTAQLVKQSFTEPALHEDFEKDNDLWMTASNADNFFVIQNGEYILHRRNTLTGYTIFPKWENQLSEYSISAGIKLAGSASDDASAGIIFMAQADNKGALIFEFNRQNQYRIKKLDGVNYKLLSGGQKNMGWVNSNFFLASDLYNRIEIRTADKNYDVYLNNNYLASFTELAYKSGRAGIVLGPGTTALVDNFFVTIPETKISVNQKDAKPGKNSLPESTDASDVITLTAGNYYYMINQIEELRKENDAMKGQISGLSTFNPSGDTLSDTMALRGKIASLMLEVQQQANENDSLRKVIKTSSETMDKTELINALTNTLKKEKQLNEMLAKENKDLKETIERFK
jgi:hypothetical protein